MVQKEDIDIYILVIVFAQMHARAWYGVRECVCTFVKQETKAGVCVVVCVCVSLSRPIITLWVRKVTG
jgi:hypothetical protein